MGKMIAFYGAPGVGKTTAALKTAMEIYGMSGSPVLFISPDMETPCLAYLLPNLKDGELYSLGATLDHTDIYREDVMKEIVSVKSMRDFGFMGFRLGENRYTYPRVTEDKVMAFFRIAGGIAEHVVVDCSSDHDDLVSILAKSCADTAVHIIKPDIKCLAWCGSHPESREDRVTVMNIVDKDLFLPIRDIQSHYKNIALTLPYSKAIKQQAITGTLTEKLGDKRYMGAVRKIAKAVI